MISYKSQIGKRPFFVLKVARCSTDDTTFDMVNLNYVQAPEKNENINRRSVDSPYSMLKYSIDSYISIVSYIPQQKQSAIILLLKLVEQA